jgi:hypothetical protein
MFPRSISTYFQGVQLFKNAFFRFFHFLLPQISASLRYEQVPSYFVCFVIAQCTKGMINERITSQLSPVLLSRTIKVMVWAQMNFDFVAHSTVRV